MLLKSFHSIRIPEKKADEMRQPSHLKAALFRFLNAEDGPTAVEYAVMLALILVVCITIVKNLGTSSSSTFTKVNSTLSS